MRLVAVLNVVIWAILGGVLAAWLVPPPGADADTKDAWRRYAIIVGAAVAAAVIGLVIQKVSGWATTTKVPEAIDVEIPTVGTAMEGATPPSSEPAPPEPTALPEPDQ